MKNRYIILFFVVSFIMGFMLREMFHGVSGISYNDYHESIPEYTPIRETEPAREGQAQHDTADIKTKAITILGIETPSKLLRGEQSEMNAYIRFADAESRDYVLIVSLQDMAGDFILKAGQYAIRTDPQWSQYDTTKLGPFKLSIPDIAPAGTYILSARLYRGQEEISRYTYGEIEIARL